MKELNVNLNKNVDSSYKIILQKGLLTNIGTHLEDRRYFVITNDKIARIYADFLKNFEKSRIIIIKDGEKYKNIKTINYILEALLTKRIERTDCIIAFGGGVIGDMAGFSASCVLRGVDFIQIPTTLLAQVDSSVGGKTGFNTPHGKNLIGAFYQPKKVLIDPNTLETLSDKDFKSGMGEVVKYAFIENSTGAREKFNLFEMIKNKAQIEEIIYACISMKAAVVEQDEKEKGLRAILNLGHTYAHAIEKITNYKKYSHGQAVALGTKMALKASYLKGLTDENYYNFGVDFINSNNLIQKTEKFKGAQVIEIMKSDKKVRGGKINLMLPLNSARAQLFCDIDGQLIEDSLL